MRGQRFEVEHNAEDRPWQPEELARRLVTGEQREDGLAEVKMRAREVARDVDAVPTVVIEGRRRDLTLTGAKEVADYVKALQTIIKESK